MELSQFFSKNGIPDHFILGANGRSMIPAIVKGDILHFKRCLGAKPLIGEVVLAKLQSGRLVIHRVVSAAPEVKTKGDAAEQVDEPVSEVLANLVKVEKTWRSRFRRFTLILRNDGIKSTK